MPDENNDQEFDPQAHLGRVYRLIIEAHDGIRNCQMAQGELDIYLSGSETCLEMAAHELDTVAKHLGSDPDWWMTKDRRG